MMTAIYHQNGSDLHSEVVNDLVAGGNRVSGVFRSENGFAPGVWGKRTPCPDAEFSSLARLTRG